MRDCQTCIHSIPIFVTSDIYVDGYSQICRDCKTKRKDGYEPIYDEAKKMTNAEKFKEVFGFEPFTICPSLLCSECPLEDKDKCGKTNIASWWNSEYKESAK